MSDKKILQIIPAPESLYTIYRDGDEVFNLRVVCLALVEDDGERYVDLMDICDDGTIDFITGGFLGIAFNVKGAKHD